MQDTTKPDNEKAAMIDVYIPIAHLEEGRQYHQRFMVGDISYTHKMQTSRGVPFARLVLQDTTGKIEGILWGFSEDLGIEIGSFITCTIDVQPYNDMISFTTSDKDIDEISSDLPDNMYDYIVGITETEFRANAQKLQCYVEEINDEDYRNLMGNAMSDQISLMSLLKEAPYGLRGPLAYPGGLLTHIINSLSFSNPVRQNYSININPSLITVGTILRNIGWATTTRFINSVLQPLDAYHMTGLYRASARMINHLFITTESDLGIKIPEAKQQALENLCNPSSKIHTIEGRIVAQADNMADLIEFGNYNTNPFTKHI